jgi:hypothetical protein
MPKSPVEGFDHLGHALALIPWAWLPYFWLASVMSVERKSEKAQPSLDDVNAVEMGSDDDIYDFIP